VNRPACVGSPAFPTVLPTVAEHVCASALLVVADIVMNMPIAQRRTHKRFGIVDTPRV
jgi:hypothetical protein